MDSKIELIPVPVTDVDRAKKFYAEQLGFAVDVDHADGDAFRIVQLTPPGSGCSIAIGIGVCEMRPGNLIGVQLVVADIHAAREELAERGVDIGSVFHYEDGKRVDGPGGDWNSFLTLSDPDGNRWVVQERPGRRVTSKDGTSISYRRYGTGPAVILVGGGIDDGAENEPLAKKLSERFTVYNYARRGRAGSGDRTEPRVRAEPSEPGSARSPAVGDRGSSGGPPAHPRSPQARTVPYAVEREIEDLAALIAEAGGSAHLFGASSGGALVLEAMAAGLPVDRAAVYEVPYSIGDEAARRWREYVAALNQALADGRRDTALELFMGMAGSSDEDIAGARGSAFWPGLMELAPTLAYDAACCGVDGRPPADRLAQVRQPVLVATGGVTPDAQVGMGELATDFFTLAADAIVEILPNAERQTILNAGHMVDADALGPALTRFLTS